MALPVLPIIVPAIAAAWAMSTPAFQLAVEKGISAAIYYFLEIILMKGYITQVLVLAVMSVVFSAATAFVIWIFSALQKDIFSFLKGQLER